jgi:hypothetical protein
VCHIGFINCVLYMKNRLLNLRNKVRLISSHIYNKKFVYKVIFTIFNKLHKKDE